MGSSSVQRRGFGSLHVVFWFYCFCSGDLPAFLGRSDAAMEGSNLWRRVRNEAVSEPTSIPTGFLADGQTPFSLFWVLLLNKS